MNNKIIHRGPDSEGYYCDGNIGLGHRRLSIIDLSENGRQPMHYMDRYVIAYNGEIYNYIEIRKELSDLGYSFETNTDTEVILASFHHFGADCLSRFNGMWAFCIYDKREKKAFVSRDRFGIKPLYMRSLDKGLYFGSEIKQLLAIEPKPVVNRQVLMNYLIFGMNEISNYTFFDSITAFPPSNYMVVDTVTGKMETYSYYSLGINSGIRDMNDYEAIKGYHSILHDSISLRLRSDVKVGTCLSGGLDSSYVASVASDLYAKSSDKPFTGITARSLEKGGDETKWAQKIASLKKLDWRILTPTKEDFLENINEVINAQEEPFLTPSVFMQFFVIKKASEAGCTVLLDGQGGDETLLGYERYFASYLSSVPFISKVPDYLAISKNSKLSLINAILYNVYFNNFSVRKHLLIRRSKYLKRSYCDMADWDLIKELALSNRNLDTLQKVELTRSCLPHLLRYEDRNSMHFSVEARLPFIDYRVVEYAISLRPKLKIHNGWTKYVLREGSQTVLPDEIRWRKIKFGFESPDALWLDDKKFFMKEVNDSEILNTVFLKMPPFSNNSSLWRLFNIARWEKNFEMTF